MKKGKRISRRSVSAFLTAILLFAGVAGCSSRTQSEETTNDPPSDRVLEVRAEDENLERAEAMNEFGVKLYQQINSPNGESVNRMVSPAGLGIALSMLRTGAEEQTAQEIDEMLGLKEMDAEKIAQEYRVLLDQLMRTDPSVQLEIANSLWSREGFPLNAEFVARLEQSYGAQAQALDFASNEAVDTLNNWASDRTNEKIEEVITGQIDPSAVLFLINAIYFKGSWTETFNPAATKNKAFWTETGKPIEVPTMWQMGNYDYLEQEDFRAVRLPYGETGNFGMILALPDENITLQQFTEKQLPEFNSWSGRFAERQGMIELPKFKLEDSISLNDTLIALGMTSAFKPEAAQLGGISDSGEPLFVSQVSQDTFIEVNEEGTEAAAVTSITVDESLDASITGPFELKLNRPFFFVITDRTTGLIVFMGEVGNPAAQ